jgi:hypothetical protein
VVGTVEMEEEALGVDRDLLLVALDEDEEGAGIEVGLGDGLGEEETMGVMRVDQARKRRERGFERETLK